MTIALWSIAAIASVVVALKLLVMHDRRRLRRMIRQTRERLEREA